MSQQRDATLADWKALNRTLEDEEEAVEKLMIEQNILKARADMFQMMVHLEEDYAENLKKSHEHLQKSIAMDREQVKCLKAIRKFTENTNMARLIAFCEDQISEITAKNSEKRNSVQQELDAEIKRFTESMPLYKEYQKHQAELEELVLQREELEREEREYKSKMKLKIEVNSSLFVDDVVDMATIYLERLQIIEAIEGPLAASESSEPIQPSQSSDIAINEQVRPETAPTSICQDKIDRNEGQRLSERSGNETVTKEQSEMPKIPQPQSSIHNNAGVKDREKSDRDMPSTSSMKIATSSTSQANQKQIGSHSSFRSDVNGLDFAMPGASSLKAAPAMSLQENQKPRGLQNLAGNDARGENNKESSRVMPPPKIPTILVSQKSQKPKGKVTFAIDESLDTSSGFDMDVDEATSLPDVNSAASSAVQEERESSVEMNDVDNLGQEFDREFGDIGNWTAEQNEGKDDMNQNPTDLNLDLDFSSMDNEFGEDNEHSKPENKDGFADFDF